MCAQTGSLNTYKHAFAPLQPHIHTNTSSTAQINDWINHTHTVFACHPVCFPFIRQFQFPRLLKLYQRFHRICIQQGHLSLHQEISLPRGCLCCWNVNSPPVGCIAIYICQYMLLRAIPWAKHAAHSLSKPFFPFYSGWFLLALIYSLTGNKHTRSEFYSNAQVFI